MKKLILGALLMFTALTINAAPIVFENPVVTSPNVGTVTSGIVGDVYEVNGSGFGIGTNTPIDVDIEAYNTASSPLLVNLFADITFANWSMTILENGSQIWNSGDQSGNQFLTASISMSPASSIYNIILNGTSTQLGGFNVKFAYPPEAIGEVPLPAAVWLFGSVLLGGLAMRRRSQKMNAQAVAA